MPVGYNPYVPFTCAACGSRQKFYYGDPTDLTLPDPTAVRCHACGVVEVLDDFTHKHAEFTVDGVPPDA